jgi:hypothetical protein
MIGYFVLAYSICLILLGHPSAEDPKKKETVPMPVKQPLPFSHKQHAKLDLECNSCHPMEGTGRAGELPKAEDCMNCHQTIKKKSPAIQTLASYYKEDKPIPWVRVYKLPDFVFFGHKKHVDSKVDCETCHGPVQTRDTLWREKEISMKSCVDCHKTSRVSTACNLCHELNQ